EHLPLRERGAEVLEKELAVVPGVVPTGRDERCDLHSHYMAMFRVIGIGDRRALVDELVGRGVPAFVGFPPIYRTEGWSRGPTRGEDVEREAARCPNSELIGRECVWLHHRVLLADPDTVRAVAAHVREAVTARVRRPIPSSPSLYPPAEAAPSGCVRPWPAWPRSAMLRPMRWLSSSTRTRFPPRWPPHPVPRPAMAPGVLPRLWWHAVLAAAGRRPATPAWLSPRPRVWCSSTTMCWSARVFSPLTTGLPCPAGSATAVCASCPPPPHWSPS